MKCSERPDDHQDDDDRGGDAGDLVDHPDRLSRQGPLSLGKLLAVADEPALVSAQGEHHGKLGLEPTLAPDIEVEGQHQAEDPDDPNRRGEDYRTDPRLTLDPGTILGGPDRGLLMKEKKARQKKWAAHQKYDEGDVPRFAQRVGEAEPPRKIFHLPPFTAAITPSTLAIGVSCR